MFRTVDIVEKIAYMNRDDRGEVDHFLRHEYFHDKNKIFPKSMVATANQTPTEVVMIYYSMVGDF